MKVQTKWQRVLLTIGLGGLVYLILNCLFAYLYYQSGGIQYTSNRNPVSFFDSLYFALVTFLTIGYGDITPVTAAAKGIFFVQVYFGLILPPIFSGLLFYFIIKRPRNVFVSDDIYIRYRKNRFLLSVRVGNRGAALANVKGILELFHYRGNTRRRIHEFSQEYPLLEERWYFDIKLQEPSAKILLHDLIQAVIAKTEISLRFTLVGADTDTGDSVAVVRYYHQKSLRFGKEFKPIYQWENGRKVHYCWHNFNQIEPLEPERIAEFKGLERRVKREERRVKNEE
jgi:hypothetical protein